MRKEGKNVKLPPGRREIIRGETRGNFHLLSKRKGIPLGEEGGGWEERVTLKRKKDKFC